MSINLPDRGFIFWPVGTGDSTTIRVTNNVHLQLDLRHMAKSEERDDPAWPVIDELVKILPVFKGDPYLSVFGLTHPDRDHCQGFQKLMESVLISEIWMSPRTFREFLKGDDLCDDALAFHDEAMRRVEKTITVGNDPGPGNRIRIIGYDDLLEETEFAGFPEHFLTIPGQIITTLDGCDLHTGFQAFVHAPFQADSFGDRNDCSLAFQISLHNGSHTGRALFMGDLSYPIIHRIFSQSRRETLTWNVLLAPHHCSKSVMYWRDEDGDEDILRSHIVSEIANVACDPGYVVSSSEPVPARNNPGDNPPHAKAKSLYESIVPNAFLCTHEHPNCQSPQPIIFEVGPNGFAYIGDTPLSRSMRAAVRAASGVAVPPSVAVGFGHGTD